MTLSTDITFPFNPETFNSDDPKQFQDYMHKLIDSLTDMYQRIAQNVNGYIKTWTPIAYGLASEGAGTYTRQTGFIRRSGIITELWFDVEWSTHTGAGGLAIQLPYVTARSDGSPFTGVIQSSLAGDFYDSGYTYLVWKAEPDSTQGTIVECGSAKFAQPITIRNFQGFTGYIQYIGQEFENVSNM